MKNDKMVDCGCARTIYGEDSEHEDAVTRGGQRLDTEYNNMTAGRSLCGDEVGQVKVDVDAGQSDSGPLLYTLNETPPAPILVSIAIQNILLGLAGSLTTAYFISDIICAPPEHPIRAKLLCTTCFMTGLCTLLQSLIGVRLPIYQSVCSTFLVPLMAMRTEDRWNCQLQQELYVAQRNATAPGSVVELDPEASMYIKLREMMGCLLLASVLEVVVGATGTVGALLRFIGPLPIAVVVSLIGLSLYKIPLEYARSHWGLTVMCAALITIFTLYCERVRIPFPQRGRADKRAVSPPSRLPILQMFPVLFGIAITWGMCAILTATKMLSDDPADPAYKARTDIRLGVIHNTPWFYFPYPGQFGAPLFNTVIFVGFLTTVVSSIFETIGDYFAAAYLCGAPPPPKSAVNRGILLEGLGSVLSGAMGAGHATTSSTGNLVLIGITKVASRSCLVATGLITILLSIFGKLGAVLCTLPDPAVGGSMFVIFGVLAAIGIFTLRAVDLSSSRNLTVFGLALYCGIVIPEWVDRYPNAMQLDNPTANGVVKGILGSPMFLGGIVAILLDNTVKGSDVERGLHTRTLAHAKKTSHLTVEECYSLPGETFILKNMPWLQCLPFLKSDKSEPLPPKA